MRVQTRSARPVLHIECNDLRVQHTVASTPILVSTAFDYQRLAGSAVKVVVARVQELFGEIDHFVIIVMQRLKIFSTIDPHVVQRHTR